MNKNSSPALSDESWYPDSSIEWWFLQGYYAGRTTSKQYFMVSFFRQGFKNPRLHHGYTLIASRFDSALQQNLTSSQIDKDVFAWVLDKTAQRPKYRLYFEDIKKYGPLPPIELTADKPVFNEELLAVKWRDFLLEQTDLGLTFSLPQQILPAHHQFHAQPLTNCFTTMEEKEGQDISTSMFYHTYPLCTLTGQVDNEQVTGQVWFDHQWGSYGMFFDQKNKNMLRGWNWFGINLEDKTSWIIWLNRELDSGAVISGRAVRMSADHSLQHYENLQAQPTRFWQSERTGTCYPLDWQIRLPDEDISISFTPLADDQEIVLFGPYRSLWEGCGLARYEHQGQSLEGEARGELFGYGYLTDFRQYFLPLEERIKKNIRTFFPEIATQPLIESYCGSSAYPHPLKAYDETLFAPVWDLMKRDGKMWRPTFSLLMLEALGCPSENFASVLSVFPELSHTGSLIIDDIEDHSILRRGGETIHQKFGTDIAINAANTLYFLPFLELINHQHLSIQQKNAIYAVLIKGFIAAHLGQAADIYWSKNMTPDNLESWLKTDLEHCILQAYSSKTGALLKGSTNAAAIIANVDEETRKVCESFAENVGIAFQIMDDIKNFDPELSRKKYGEDIVEGKLTYVIVQALLNLEPQEKDYLVTILCDPLERQKNETIERVAELIRTSGILLAAQQRAADLFHQSWEQFSQHSRHSEAKIALKILCHNLLAL